MASLLLVRDHEPGVVPELRAEPLGPGQELEQISDRVGDDFEAPGFGSADLIALAEALFDLGFRVVGVDIRDTRLKPLSAGLADGVSVRIRKAINSGRKLTESEVEPVELAGYTVIGVDLRNGGESLFVRLRRSGLLDVTGLPTESGASALARFLLYLRSVWLKANLG